MTREQEDSIISQAMEILGNRMRLHKAVFTSPTEVGSYLCMMMGQLEHESFHIMFLNSQHLLIEGETMFRGTLGQTSVYPREVVRAALKHNAAAVVFCHNHPSGSVEPSRADEYLTQSLKSALALVDVRVLDHFVVSGNRWCSMAAKGLI